MFRKYSSIENSYQKAFLDKIESHEMHTGEFVVQEKAHGANLSFFSTNGTDWQVFKRTGLIEADEKFYSYELAFEKNIPLLKNLWNDIMQTTESLAQLTVFGELIGGSYKHSDVPKVGKAKPIQKGIDYCPGSEFYAFDILLNNQQYLTVDECNAMFDKHGFIFAKTLFRGTLAECIAFPNNEQSGIYKQFGLPQIADNIMEGVVIRPVDTRFLSGGERVIIKNKNEKWEEKAKQPKRPKVQKETPEHIKLLQELIMDYVTENRMRSVVSKIGQIEMKDMGKILGLFAADVVEDFMKDHADKMNLLDKKEQREVTKVFNKEAVAFVKQIMSE